MAESIMLDKAKDFAVEIINMCKNKIVFAGAIPKNMKEEMEKNNIQVFFKIRKR